MKVAERETEDIVYIRHPSTSTPLGRDDVSARRVIVCDGDLCVIEVSFYLYRSAARTLLTQERTIPRLAVNTLRCAEGEINTCFMVPLVMRSPRN